MRPSRSGSRWSLLQPYELASTAWELPVAAGCVAALFAIFVADVLTPVDVVLNALAVFPILFGVWTLGRWLALAVVSLAFGLLILEVVTGSLNHITAVAELLTYAILAVLTRRYAAHVAHIETAPPRPATTDAIDFLTRREREVVILAAQGRTAPEIAYLLHIGERTVETHLANAYPKLGVRSKLELVKEAARLGV